MATEEVSEVTGAALEAVREVRRQCVGNGRGRLRPVNG